MLNVSLIDPCCKRVIFINLLHKHCFMNFMFGLAVPLTDPQLPIAICSV